MPLDESGAFDPEPRTQAEHLAAVWQKVKLIDGKVTITNGRVSKLERAMWAIGGGMVVTGAVLVPIFIHLVLS